MTPSPRVQPHATAPVATNAPDACSVLWDRSGASAYGTAAVARFFVALEQPGPWGRNAARESHLGASLGEALETRCSSRGGRFMLLRRPGRHPDTAGPVTVLVAHAGTVPGGAWLLRGRLDRPEQLLGLDWDAVASGHRDVVAASLPGAAPAPPTLLVCTNGRRDVCCATRGRPVAAAAAAGSPGQVWESSHTGGHRFAPTGVLLPWGQTFARLSPELAAAALASAVRGHIPGGLLGPIHDRGRSALAPDAQCAESSIRARIGEEDLAALWAEPASPDAGADETLVRHRDGRAWVVTVSRQPTGAQHPESCHKDPVPVLEYHPTAIRPVPPHQGLG
ncbi:MAG TPA: sucrase ferredoxin [Dermatophilaceae bacterium]|nr:sucrase ferredoxin [Dermatophilaceae bacterium]